MTQPTPVSYRSAGPAIRAASPSEYDHAYEQERGRWLRRRLLYYTAFSVIVGIVVSLPSLVHLAASRPGPDARWRVLTLAASNAVYIVALVFAYRAQPVYERVLRIALATYLVAWLLTISVSHLFFVLSADEVEKAAISTFIVSSDKHKPESALITRESATRPYLGSTLFDKPVHYGYDEVVTPKLGQWRPSFTFPWLVETFIYASLWLTLLLSLVFNHLLISLFIPWTVRDSLRPAFIVSAAMIFMIGVDTLIGGAWWPMAVVAIIALPFTLAPGTLVCWWRYSRFHKQFKQQFESEGFKKLQEELVGARRIHEANLPAPILDGAVRVAYEYEPMREIGGDLLMLHRSRADKAVTAVLFDVTGHGVSAALSVNRIVSEIERTFAEDADAAPDKIICNLNRYVCATLARHQIYATAIVARVDASAGTLEYVNAGHPPGVMRSRAANEVLELDPTAMMLGVCTDADFDCEMLTRAFTAGDALALYTDGASEAADPQGRMIGHVGTYQAISELTHIHGDPAHWPAALRDIVIRHRAAPPNDDTLIVTIWRES